MKTIRCSHSRKEYEVLRNVNKCDPFKQYLKLLKRYLKKTGVEEQSKVMNQFSSLENALLVPGKYRINEKSKFLKRKTKISHPCLINKTKDLKERTRLSSSDTMNQTRDTKATLKGESQDKVKPKTKPKCIICATLSSYKSKECTHTKKSIISLNSKKNKGYLYLKKS